MDTGVPVIGVLAVVGNYSHASSWHVAHTGLREPLEKLRNTRIL
jgi:hypothetical protein